MIRPPQKAQYKTHELFLIVLAVNRERITFINIVF